MGLNVHNLGSHGCTADDCCLAETVLYTSDHVLVVSALDGYTAGDCYLIETLLCVFDHALVSVLHGTDHVEHGSGDVTGLTVYDHGFVE